MNKCEEEEKCVSNFFIYISWGPLWVRRKNEEERKRKEEDEDKERGKKKREGDEEDDGTSPRRCCWLLPPCRCCCVCCLGRAPASVSARGPPIKPRVNVYVVVTHPNQSINNKSLSLHIYTV
jgi:hypothetical protein